ncbi:MAG: Histidine kinase, partial [Belnapia sp.]|nr:Histidine kinase [Belnapia sp.]
QARLHKVCGLVARLLFHRLRDQVGAWLGSWRLRLLTLALLAALPPVAATLWAQQRLAEDRLAEVGGALQALAGEQAARLAQGHDDHAASALPDALPDGVESMLLADTAGRVMALVPPVPVGGGLHGAGLALALAEKAGHGLAIGLAGTTRLFGVAPVPGTGTLLVLERDPADVLAPLHALRRQGLLLAASAIAMALLLALAAGHWMVLLPMRRFAEGVRRIALGDLGARTWTGRFGGELGGLAREVNVMASRLAEQQAALEARHAELAQLATALAAARDAAEAASAAKTRFLGMLSHELRTPLNGILGHAQLLAADRALSPAQWRCAEQITASGEHLMAMIRELLDLAAIEAGKLTLTPAPVRLAALTEACAAVIRPAAADKGLAFGVQLAPDSAGWVAADALRLRQVLLNLLANAVKFTARGEVVLRIRRAAGGLTRFEVTDTGPGMDAAGRASLFQEFHRLPGTAQAEGSGLGLAIAARLVARMGGSIGCESEPGRGSLFWVELPLPPAEAAAADALPEDALPEDVLPADALPAGALATGPHAARPVVRRLRLLLADDVLVNREVARALLGGAGHTVTVVADGAQALAAALAEDWDAVLLDVHMPEMDGLTAARLIRVAPGPRGRVPILAVTASASPAEVAACLAAGMDAHVEKPLRTLDLQDALTAILARAAWPALPQPARPLLAQGQPLAAESRSAAGRGIEASRWPWNRGQPLAAE